jgi:DNA-binding winged helix-turn-helix (wHTH) protein/TolB-like protein
MSAPSPARSHRFGPFRFDPVERSLSRDGEPVPLMPKTIDTLAVLLERRGQVVEKAELMKLVWPDCVVEEVGLARNISLLRQALGSDGEAYVETVPRRGYRFTAGEDEATGQLPAVKRRPILPLVAGVGALLLAAFVYWQFYQPSRFVPAQGQRAFLAVATIEIIGPELELTGFSRAFTETLAAELAKHDSVQLISPSTVRRYERWGIPTALMARMLGLHVIVEGAARRSGTLVRIAIRLSDVHSGRLIWAENYEIPAADLASAESGVARTVAAQISQRLSH